MVRHLFFVLGNFACFLQVGKDFEAMCEVKWSIVDNFQVDADLYISSIRQWVFHLGD